MAITPKDINHSIEDRIVLLQANLSSTNKKYPDLLKEKFGSSRPSDILAKIGNTHNLPYDQRLDEYLNSL